MSPIEALFILPLVLMGVYLVVGLIYGFSHVAVIVRRITEIGEQERILRQKVAMYDMTPAGAAYFIDLQDMHIQYKEPLAEYDQYVTNKAKYRRGIYAAGCLFWVYYMAALYVYDRQNLPEGIEKAEV